MMKFVAVAFVAMIFLIVGCGEIKSHQNSHNQSESDKTEFEINISNGSLVDGQERLVVTKDQNVRLIINSGQDLVIHLHGYDIEKTIKANQEDYLEFHAHATGRFLVNTHALLEGGKDGHDHKSHSSTEESENLLMTIEVHPK